MKTFIWLFVGSILAGCVPAAGAELSPVPVVVSKQQFKPGDVIVIEQVLATSPKPGIGDRVVVRGHYRLASEPKASLGLFVTHRSLAGPDSPTKTQTTRVESASGSFELSCEVTDVGDMHVSFYPAYGGEAFGGVYFTTNVKGS